MGKDQYIQRIDADSATEAQRRETVNAIGEFLKDAYGAETSRLNRNMWEMRFDLEIDTADELQRIISEVNELYDMSPLDGHQISWKVITSDHNGQHDGYTNIGVRGEHADTLGDAQFPILAFDVSLER